MNNYLVYYPSQVDVDAWKVAYDEEAKPDAWPYGLNRLEDESTGVSHKSIHRQNSFVAAAASLLQKPRRTTRGVSTPLSVTWDERTALDLYLAGEGGYFATGVIWATDQLRVPAAALRLRLLRRVLRDAGAIWCLSTAQLPILDRWLGKRSRSGMAEYLPFGIDTDFYSARSQESDDLIFSVGGDRDRDPETLFAALASTISARPGTRAVVQTTSTIKPPDGVSVVKHLAHAELREMYAKATVVAVATKPNLHVSGMTVSLEAAATGRPVVITKTPGMTDYVRDGLTGLLTPVGDASAMAASIISLLDQPGRATEIGQAARSHVARNHSSSIMAARLRDILESKALK